MAQSKECPLLGKQLIYWLILELKIIITVFPVRKNIIS